jgi:hypothetical protein
VSSKKADKQQKNKSREASTQQQERHAEEQQNSRNSARIFAKSARYIPLAPSPPPHLKKRVFV